MAVRCRAVPAVVDATDERAVDEYARSVAENAGSLDISMNLITRSDLQGTPLAEMAVADLVAPVKDGIATNFTTARAAARHMADQGSGVILALNSDSAGGSPTMGGTGPAGAAIDSFIRNAAAGIGPRGVRVLGIWAAGIPETLSTEAASKANPAMQMDEAGSANLLQQLDSMRLTRRSPHLAEIAATAAFLASPSARGITGTFVNCTSMFAS